MSKKNDGLIDKLNLYLIALIAFFSVIIIIILNIIFSNIGALGGYLNVFNDYELIGTFLLQNKQYLIPSLIVYILFIGYISLRKGLVITQGVNGSYFQILGIIYKGMNFLLIPYLWYLFKSDFILELVSLIIVAFIMLPVIVSKTLLVYNQIRNNYKLLELINKHKNKVTFKDSFNNLLEEENNISTLAFLIILYKEYYSWMSLIISILIVPIGIYFSFSLITILYLHISFILIYIGLNILLNVFPGYVTLRYGKTNKSGFLLEKTRENTTLMTKKEIYIFKPNKIDYIKFKR